MDDAKRMDYQSSYDRVADEYVRRIFDELQHKPLDRQLLDRFAARVRDIGPACDLGCGPGHVARYLQERGVPVCGVDLSPAMVQRARGLTPAVEFRQGDLMALDAPDGAWAGIAAFSPSSTFRAATCCGRWASCGGSCDRAGSCYWRSTSAMGPFIWMSGGATRSAWTSSFSAPTRWQATSVRRDSRLRRLSSGSRILMSSTRAGGLTFSPDAPRRVD